MIKENKNLLWFIISSAIIIVLFESIIDITSGEKSTRFLVANLTLTAFTVITILLTIYLFKRMLNENEKAIKEAKENHNKFKMLIDFSPTNVLVTDAETGKIIDVNNAYLKRWNKRKEEVVGEPADLLWQFPEERKKFINEIIEKGETKDFRALIKNGNGKEAVVSLHGKLIKLDGRDRVISYSREITKEIEREKKTELELIELEAKINERTEELQFLNKNLKKEIEYRGIAEKALRESEFKYRTLINSLPLGIYRTTLDGKFVHANPALARILGYTSTQDLLNSSVYEFYRNNGERDEIISKSISKKSEDVIVKEIQLVRKDGAEIWVADNGRIIYDESGNPKLIDGIIQDISHNKFIYDQLRESKERYSRLFESLHDIYFKINLAGKIQNISPSVKNLGISVSEVLGKDIRNFVANKQQIKEFYKLIKKKQRISDYLITLKNNNYEQIHISVNAHFHADDGSGSAEIEGIAHDITQQINTREYINALYQISRAVNSSDSVEKLYEIIHRSLSRIINTDNFYIALVDRRLNYITFPYVIDQVDSHYDPIHLDHPSSVTAQIIRTGESIFMDEYDLKTYEEENGETIGTIPKSFIGAPLKLGSEVIGAMCLQIYDNHKGYKKEDVELLNTVSDQIALAIDRTRASINLNFQLNFIQNLMDTIPSPVFYKDKNKRYQGCNKAFEDFIGKTSREIISKTAWDIYDSASAKVYDETDDEILINPGITVFESEFKHSDGSIRSAIFHKSSYFDNEGEVSGIVGVLIDISERKKMELELSWQATMNKVVAEVSEAILSTKSLGEISDILLDRLLRLTKSPLGIIGCVDKKEGEVILLSSSKNLKNGVKEGETLSIKYFERLLKKNEAFLINEFERVSYLFNFPKEHLKIKRALGSPVMSGDDLIGLILVANSEQDYEEKDISLIRKIAGLFSIVFQKLLTDNEMKKALEKEQELSLMKSKFISMVSHEYRTPLTAIVLSTELLHDYSDLLSKEEKQKHYNRIKQSVENMNNLLEDIITLNKIDVNKQKLNIQLVDLEKVCYSISSSVEFMFKNKNKINFTIDPGIPRVRLDEVVLRKVITNLLTNSMKYTTTDADIEFQIRKEEEEIKFIVSDKGIGMSKEDLEKAFEPFHRGENVGAISGTGLGMCIIKNSIEQCGGSIKIESELGAGTTVTVALPLNCENKMLENHTN